MISLIKNAALILVISCLGIISWAQKSQSVSLGNFFIPAKGYVSIFSDHNFQDVSTGLLSGIVATDRSNGAGKIIFSEKSSWSNAGILSHVDGYVKSLSNGSFVFPTGDNGIYSPVGLSKAYNSSAAYFAVDPTEAVTSIVLSDAYTDIPELGPYDISSKVNDLVSVSDKEYWEISGSLPTRITLTWSDYSEVENLVKSDLQRLTIVGWDGTEWVPISSDIDQFVLDKSKSDYSKSVFRSGFLNGSITTTEEIVPDAYHVYSLGLIDLNKSFDKNNLTLYPNPVKSGSFVKVNYFLAKSKTGKLRIFNSAHQLIFEQDLISQEDKIEIPLEVQSRGIFTLALTSAYGQTIYKKLIVVDL